MVIHMGNQQTIPCCQPYYGLHETPIMHKRILKLLALGFVKPGDSRSQWGARITPAPNPPEENITQTENYIGGFCIDYTRLNIVTQPAEYPIPRCDDAVMYGFGEATIFVPVFRPF